jgi:predicted ATPase
LPLQVSLGQAFIPLKGWSAPEVGRPFERAQTICERLGNSRELFPVLFGHQSVHNVRGQLRPARELGVELLRLARVASDPALLIMAHYALGIVLHYTGDLAAAREHQESVLRLWDDQRDRRFALLLGTDPKSGCLSHAGCTLWCLGYADQAVAMCMKAVVAADIDPNPFSKAAAQFFFNVVHILRGDARAVQDGAEWVIDFCTKHGLGLWPLFSQGHHGWAFAQHGRREEGLAENLSSLQMQHAVGADVGRPHALCMLVDIYFVMGRFDEALNTLAEAFNEMEINGGGYYEAEVYRLRGEVLLKMDFANGAEAQRCFEQAIDTARRQSGKSLELRATTSLARLLDRQGYREKAREVLAEIYNWFTEGFDTADLNEAKALLNELFS